MVQPNERRRHPAPSRQQRRLEASWNRDGYRNLVAQVTKHETSKTRRKPFASFAEYVLDPTSEGLGVADSDALHDLSLAMDITGEHASEWADVVARVEKMRKLIIVTAPEGRIVFQPVKTAAEEKAARQNAERVRRFRERQKPDDAALKMLAKLRPKDLASDFDERVRAQLERLGARQRAKAASAVIQLDWEIILDDGGAYVSTYEEPYGLYVSQCADTFYWQLVKDDDDNETKRAEGDAPSWSRPWRRPKLRDESAEGLMPLCNRDV
jgi:hypothetical protein